MRWIDVVALAELLRLEDLKLYERGDFKGHYFGVSVILKTYLGRRFHFDALESTTDELLARIQYMGVAPLALERLVALFSKLDRVKFTDQVPSNDEVRNLISEARDIVGLTKRPPVLAGLPNGSHSERGAHAV